MAISTIAKIERLYNVHGGSPQTTKRNPPQITKFYSMIFNTHMGYATFFSASPWLWRGDIVG